MIRNDPLTPVFSNSFHGLPTSFVITAIAADRNASGINTKVAKYLGRETVIGDALTLPWDIAQDADVNKYGYKELKGGLVLMFMGI